MEKYNKLSSDLKTEKAKFVNLQENLETCTADLESKNKIINRLTKEIENLKKEQIEESNTHRNELYHITDQMKTAYETLESKQKKLQRKTNQWLR